MRAICYLTVLLRALMLRLVRVCALEFSSPGVVTYVRLLISLRWTNVVLIAGLFLSSRRCILVLHTRARVVVGLRLGTI